MDAKGEPVTAGNLILGKMPIERAERRNKKYRDEGNDNAAAATERFNPDHGESAYRAVRAFASFARRVAD